MDSKLEAHLIEAIPRAAAQRRRINKQDMDQIASSVSPDDVVQEMWLIALDNEAVLLSHLAEGNDRAITTILMSGALRMIRAEVQQTRTLKAVEAGYETYDEEFYSAGALRRLIPMYLDGGVCERPPVAREQTWKVSGGGSGGYGEYMTVMADIDQGFKSLSEAKRKILTRYFAYPQGSGGLTHTEIASRMGMPPGELKSRVHSAIQTLQRRLGGSNPWRGR